MSTTTMAVQTAPYSGKLHLDIHSRPLPMLPVAEPPLPTPSSTPPSPNDSDLVLSRSAAHASSSSDEPHTRDSSTTHTTASSRSSLIDSASTTPSSLSIKFAPLPEIAPRKRKSTTPLGMAARGQLMRRRRQQMNGGDPEDDGPRPSQIAWMDEEMEMHRRRAEAVAARNAQVQASEAAAAARFHEQEEAELERRLAMQQTRTREMRRTASEDASVFGKIVKKSLFKRGSSSKDLTLTREASPGPPVLRRRKSDAGAPLPPTPQTAVPAVPPVPLRPILTNLDRAPSVPSPILNIAQDVEMASSPVSEEQEPVPEEGGVWEEEISDSFLQNVGQTDTIVEGRNGIFTSTIEISSKTTRRTSWSTAQLSEATNRMSIAGDRS